MQPDAPAESRLQSRVPADATGQMLGAWLAQRFRYLDAAGWEQALAEDRVLHNGRPARAQDRIAAGDLVVFRPAPAAPRPDLVLPLALDDPDFVVVDKPPNLVAHRDGAFAQNTFVAELERRFAERGEVVRLQFVHRLDRETSGLCVLAKNAAANAHLQQQFAAGEVQKTYLALVHGVVREQRFTIDAPIGPAVGGPVAARRAVCSIGAPGARPARTGVEVVARFAAHSLLRLAPHTGRTHQLRVHLEHLGHALVGDKLYGQSDATYLAYVQHRKAGGDAAWGHLLGAARQLLHAATLRFVHPRTHLPVALEAAPPHDFAAFLASLGPPRDRTADGAV